MNSFFSGLVGELINLLPSVPAILWAISFHEFCHGWVAGLCGDPTARLDGRLTLNPLAHFDPWGLLCLFLFHFGWAKPVPIDPRYFKRPRRDLVLVSLAGIAGNILSAVVFGLMIHALLRTVPRMFLSNYGLQQVLLAFVIINLNFAVFNILPIPPLDGAKLLYMVLPPQWMSVSFWLERHGFLILLLLIYLGVVEKFMRPLVRFGLALILG